MLFMWYTSFPNWERPCSTCFLDIDSLYKIFCSPVLIINFLHIRFLLSSLTVFRGLLQLIEWEFSQLSCPLVFSRWRATLEGHGVLKELFSVYLPSSLLRWSASIYLKICCTLTGSFFTYCFQLSHHITAASNLKKSLSISGIILLGLSFLYLRL